MNKYWKSIIFLGIYDLAVFVLRLFFNEPGFIGVALILSVLIPIYIYAFKFSWPGVYIFAGFSTVILSIYWLIYLINNDWYFYWNSGWDKIGQFFLAPFFNNDLNYTVLLLVLSFVIHVVICGLIPEKRFEKFH